MRWNDLEPGWRAAFAMAWEAYTAGTMPIGAAIINADGVVVASARNRIADSPGLSGQIAGHQLGHAEINAILQLDEDHGHPDIRTYTLYTTVEPCPLCFGAIVMGSIRRFCFAARDAHAGAAALAATYPYAMSKGIVANGPFPELEPVALALEAEAVLAGNPAHRVLAKWERECPEGIALARRLHQDGTLTSLKEKGAPAPDVIDRLFSLLCER